MTAMLFAERLKELGADPAWVDLIMRSSKDEVAHALIAYYKEKQHGPTTVGTFS